MGISIETSIWEPSISIYIFLFLSCAFSILLFPHFTKHHKNQSTTPFFDGPTSSSSSFRRFQRNFLFLYTLASVMEGVWSVFGEFELTRYGFDKEQIVFYLCVGYAASLFIGTFLGPVSDIVGQKRICLLFCTLHLIVSIWKKISSHPSIWVANICLSLATSVSFFCFETWAVVEHEKLEHGQDALSDTFWLMTFFESASLIGSQVLANWLVGSNLEKGILSISTATVFLAIIGIICVTREWTECYQTAVLKDYRMSFYTYIVRDKRIMLLVWAQACLQFSLVVFWLLWAPTLVADGREVLLGLLFPCFLGARMLGSTMFPWMVSGPSSIRTEDCLQYAFILLGLIFAIIAYDYQEIGFLTTLFCLFNCCVGLVLPSLARLRTMYVPNELRGGMMSLSNAPANGAILIFLVQRGYYNNFENSTLIASASTGLFMAAGCMHMLKRRGKQPYQNWHKL